MNVKWMSAFVAALALLPQAQGQRPGRAEPDGIPVHYSEGMVHGFLELHTMDGAAIADGDLVQLHKGNGMETRMTLRFHDGSFFEETVDFTQHEVFELQSYHLVQRGPAFLRDLDALLQRPNVYHVTAKSHDGDEEKRWDGTMDMPPDTYNGLIITALKNLNAGETQTVHIVAFTPQPRMVKVEMSPVGQQRIVNGTHSEGSVVFDLKPRLGALIGFFARLTGKLPPDSHVWVIQDEVPAFLRSEGPLYDGTVWRLDLSSPHFPRSADAPAPDTRH